MNQNNDWKSTEPETWKPTKTGEVLQGTLYQKRGRTDNRSAFYHIQDSQNQLHLVWGSATLDRGLQSVEQGQEVRITYQGTKDIGKKYPLKLFDVVYRDNPNSKIQLSEEMVGVLQDA